MKQFKNMLFTLEDDEGEEEEVTPKEEKRTKTRQTTQTVQTTRTSEDFSAPGVKKGKVVTLNSGGAQEIALLKLDTFEGARTIVDHMKQRIPVVFNLARLDHSDAVRVVDMVCGASYALDGSVEKASKEIFIVTPNGVKITGDIKESLYGSNDFSLDI
ncbi:MAG: cell division protein SepF [Clostridia bacterium]|nr:cell division protein SepF [Clostridia bacterium]